MLFGVSYYPELVDPSEWERDLRLMRENGLTIVRMLEFAWTWFEPREGEEDFAACDAFLELTHRHGMQAILGTPTASPPAWLLRQYPQIGCVLRDGRRLQYGARRRACVNSSIYRHFSGNVAERLARRYGRHSAVLGWQIDNELIGPEVSNEFVCHCDDCQWRFRDWLKQRYSSVRALNEAWGLKFWSLEFGDWGEISTPLRGGALGHHLDAYRFYSDSQVQYIRLQYDAMKPHLDERQFISHNSTAVFDRGIDHRAYARAMDQTGWDAYTGAAAADHPGTWPFAGLACDLFRSARHKPYWIFETDTARNQRPSYLAELAARGAQGICFWHWRQHRAGAEQRNPALCDHAGEPFPDRMAMVRNTIERLNTEPDFSQTLPRRRVGFIFTPDCVRAQHRNAARPIPYLDAVHGLYEPLWRHGVAVDVVGPDEDFSHFKLLVMPALSLMSDAQAERIRSFVSNGGILLAAGETAHMDLHGVLYPHRGQPLLDVLGIRISPESPAGDEGTILFADGQMHPARCMELIEPAGGTVLASFVETDRRKTPVTPTRHPVGSHPAVIEHAFGRGRAFYFAGRGTAPAAWIARRAVLAAGIKWYDSPAEDVGLFPHLTRDALWCFNHTDKTIKYGDQTLAPGQFALTETSQRLTPDSLEPATASVARP